MSATSQQDSTGLMTTDQEGLQGQENLTKYSQQTRAEDSLESIQQFLQQAIESRWCFPPGQGLDSATISSKNAHAALTGLKDFNAPNDESPISDSEEWKIVISGLVQDKGIPNKDVLKVRKSIEVYLDEPFKQVSNSLEHWCESRLHDPENAEEDYDTLLNDIQLLPDFGRDTEMGSEYAKLKSSLEDSIKSLTELGMADLIQDRIWWNRDQAMNTIHKSKTIFVRLVAATMQMPASLQATNDWVDIMCKLIQIL